MARARTKPTINVDRLVKFLRSGDLKHSDAAKKLGVEPGQLDMMTFHRARLMAKRTTKAPPTSASVRKLRDNEKARWEEVSVRTGLSIAAAKEAYEEAGGDSTQRANASEDNGSTTKRGHERSSAKRAQAEFASAHLDEARMLRRGRNAETSTPGGAPQGSSANPPSGGWKPRAAMTRR
jgi:hypothetical protein